MNTRTGNVCPSCGTRYPADAQFCPLDGTKVVPITSDSFEVIDLTGDRIFGDYIIRKKLGEGGMGAVYLAENVAIDQRIAIKVLHAAGEQTEELVQRFNREARTISRLTHPNIIRVFIFGKTEDGVIYLAMEYVEGRTLGQILEEGKTIKPKRAIRILRQVLHALNEAHDLGIVHRDLKPDNIMLTHFRGVDDYVKVLDFGIAKVQDKGEEVQKKLTQAGVVYGTPEYLSPEQAAAKSLDARSDLYSVGIILYEMMTGTVPFTGSTAHSVLAGHVFDSPPKPSEVTSKHVHPEMERIILKTIEKSPKARYQNAMEMLHDLESVEAKLQGSKARRTTVLDPTESSLLYEVSRASESDGDDEASEDAKRTKASDSIQTEAAKPQRKTVKRQTPREPLPAQKQGENEEESVAQTSNTGAIVTIAVLVLAIIVLGVLLFMQRADAAPGAIPSANQQTELTQEATPNSTRFSTYSSAKSIRK
jgi:serine/threonine-protein kinase